MLTVKQWRLAKGLTQEEMAEACGVHRNTYAIWENEPENITIGNAKIIAAVIGEPINHIFFTLDSTKCGIEAEESIN